jgi:hypothetical protein
MALLPPALVFAWVSNPQSVKVVVGGAGTIEAGGSPFRGYYMDEEQRRRLAEGYRQMRDEQLAALLVEQSTLTDEARQALLDAIAARPDPAGIHRQALDEVRSKAERQARKEAEAKAKEAAKVQRSGNRPGLGPWLWLLTVNLAALALWPVYDYAMLRLSEAQLPELREMPEWPVAKAIFLGVSVSALIAAGIGIRALHAGTTHGHLGRAIGALWYILPGVLVIELALSGMLYGFDNVRRSLSHLPTVLHLVIALLVASLWTVYLLRSERCRHRYPKKVAERSMVRAFD